MATNDPPDSPAAPAAPAPPAVPGAAQVSDEELVARARTKDFGAFEQLLDRYEDKIFRLAYRFVRNETEAKEVVQDTEELPVGYLDNYGHLPPAGENWAKRPDDELQSDELRRHIQTAVDGLPEIYRTVFLLRDVEGLSTEETGDILGISVPTVKTRLHRARIALRDNISGYFNKR
jgi:RNA polymerase sigma-70 factor (ECF subfamily)